MAERPRSVRKRKRREEEEDRYGRKRTGCVSEKSHFDSLSAEAITNIIRFTSERPHHENWKGYILPQVVVALFDSFCDLAGYASDMFRSLEVNRKPDNWKTMLCVTLWDRRMRLCFPRLLSLLEGRLTELKLTSCSWAVARRISQTCNFPNLKRLSFSPEDGVNTCLLSDIFAVHGGNVEHLHVRQPHLSEEDVKCICEYGRSLKSFYLDVRNISTDSSRIWEAIGEGLEEITLHSPLVKRSGDMSSIVRNCKSLKHIIVRDIPSECLQALEALCRTSGSLLQSLSFSGRIDPIDMPRLGRIVSACKNVAVSLWPRNGCSAAALLAIGARAHHIDIGPDTVEDCEENFESLALAAKRCENLAGITVDETISRVALETLLFHPKPLLVEFRALFEPEVNADFVFEGLSRHVSSLEAFEFEGTIPPKPVLQAFVESNSLLKSVKLVDMRGRCRCGNPRSMVLNNKKAKRDPGFDWGIVAKVFLQCHKLTRLSISCYEGTYEAPPKAFRNEDYVTACLCARHRNVDITICRYQYS